MEKRTYFYYYTQYSRAIMLSFFLCLYSLSTAHAQTKTATTTEENTKDFKTSVIELLQQKIQGKSGEVKSIEAEIDAYKEKLRTAAGQKKTLQNNIVTLDLNKKIITKDIDLTSKKIEITSDTIETLDAQIERLRRQIKRNEIFLKHSLQELYQEESTRGADVITIVLTSTSFSELFDKTISINQYKESLLSQLERVQQSKKDVEAAQQIHASEKSKLLTLTEQLALKKKVIEQTKTEKSYLLAQTKNKESEYQKELALQLKRKSELEQEMRLYEDTLRAEIDPNSLPAIGSKSLSWPLKDHVLTQYFGDTAFTRSRANVYKGVGHNGIDFRASVGTPVLSALSGTVVGTGNTDESCKGASWGRWVLIRHGNGLSTLYAHLSIISVSAGQFVTTGQTIGLSGNTGYSTGPHLHFTVYASNAVQIITRESKSCGTMMRLPVSPLNGYLNPLQYL